MRRTGRGEVLLGGHLLAAHLHALLVERLQPVPGHAVHVEVPLRPFGCRRTAAVPRARLVHAELARRFPAFKRALEPDGGLWIGWPKRASGVVTDLSENPVREIGLDNGLVDNKVAAIDDTWSGLRFVYRVKDRPKP